MGKRSGSAIGLLLVVVAFLVFPLVLDSFDSVGRAEATNTATVTTGVGVTTGNVTLHNSLYENVVTSVNNITSTDNDDAPLSASYATATKALAISGLDGNTTRTLTVTYDTARNEYNLAALTGFTPLIVFLVLLLSALAMLWRTWR